MRLTRADRRTLILMTNLAAQWESTLADANGENEPSGGNRAVISRCNANIKRFYALKDKLLAENRKPQLGRTKG